MGKIKTLNGVENENILDVIFTNDIIQDASYISLRNVNIGYNFSKDLSKVGSPPPQTT